jgi:hypothetical protein
MKDGIPVSVAEMIAAGARPFPPEAVAILLDVCEQVTRQPAGRSVLPPITPSALFIDGSGTVAVAGGVPVEDDQTVQLLGRLLLQMLPVAGSLGAARVPSRLQSLAARAADGQLRRLSVGRLASSLRRFAPQNPRGAVRALFERWRGPGAPGLAALPAPVSSSESGDWPVRPPGRGFPRRAVGALVATLLILASVGAAYWLNADTAMPPIPLSPSLLMSEPPTPPRDGWELLDPAGLAVDATEPRHDGVDGTSAGRAAAPDQVAKVPRAQPESVAVHRPDQ